MDYTKVPKNTALDVGESVTLNCARVNENDHTTGLWTFTSAIDGAGGIIASNFTFQPGLGDVFEFPTEEFNLKLKSLSKPYVGKNNVSFW